MSNRTANPIYLAAFGLLGLLIAGCYTLPATLSETAAGNAKQQDGKNQTTPQELFAYPAEQSEIESKQNARNRTPIYIPKKCAENEILYPGDHDSDWVCDCKPTFVYHPETQQCYQMYRRGYCAEGEYIYMEPKGKTAMCVATKCPDGQVVFRNGCVELNKEHEDCHVAGLRMVVGIDEKTHELSCINISDVKFNLTMFNNLRENATIQVQNIANIH